MVDIADKKQMNWIGHVLHGNSLMRQGVLEKRIAEKKVIWTDDAHRIKTGL